jgi:two-component system, NarL family, nitrate/nitrite response regulator NarL
MHTLVGSSLNGDGGKRQVPKAAIQEGTMTQHKAPKILLVDDNSAVRQGLALVLEAEAIGSCCEACGRKQALDIAGRESPDLALLDLNMGDGDATALLAEFRKMRIPVLVCSMDDNPSQVRRALAGGARGYITKSETREVARAVRGVLQGWMLISPRAAEGLEHED